MPGTIQVSVLELKDLPSSSVSLKVSMGKREYRTSEKGDFSFPLMTLRDKLIVSICDPDGNEISQTGVETKSVVEKGIWDDMFILEGGGHLHMKLQFILSEKERDRIKEMRESALKKKRGEILNKSHTHSSNSEYYAMALASESLSLNYEVTVSRKSYAPEKAGSIAWNYLEGHSTADLVSRVNKPLFDHGNNESTLNGLEQSNTSNNTGNLEWSLSINQLSQGSKALNSINGNMKAIEKFQTQSPAISVHNKPIPVLKAVNHQLQHTETLNIKTKSPLVKDITIANPTNDEYAHSPPVDISLMAHYTAEDGSGIAAAEEISQICTDVTEESSSAVQFPQERDAFTLTDENEKISEKIENQSFPIDIHIKPNIFSAVEFASPLVSTTLEKTPSNVKKMISAFETSLPQNSSVSPPRDRFQSSKTRAEVHLKGPSIEEGKTERMKPWEADLQQSNKSKRSDQTALDAQKIFGSSIKKVISHSDVSVMLTNLSKKSMFKEQGKEGLLDEKDNTLFNRLKGPNSQEAKIVQTNSSTQLNSSLSSVALEVDLLKGEEDITRDQIHFDAQALGGASSMLRACKSTSQLDVLEIQKKAEVAELSEQGCDLNISPLIKPLELNLTGSSQFLNFKKAFGALIADGSNDTIVLDTRNAVAGESNADVIVKVEEHHTDENVNEPVSLLEDLVDSSTTKDVILTRGMLSGTNETSPLSSMRESQLNHPLEVTEDLSPLDERRWSRADKHNSYECVQNLMFSDETKTLCVTTASKQLMELLYSEDTFAGSTQEEICLPTKDAGGENIDDAYAGNKNESIIDRATESKKESSARIRIPEAFIGQAVRVAALVVLGTFAIVTRPRNTR